MQTGRWNPSGSMGLGVQQWVQEVLPSEYYRQLETTPFFALEIAVNQCEALIRNLARVAPLPQHMTHLKRVKPLFETTRDGVLDGESTLATRQLYQERPLRVLILLEDSQEASVRVMEQLFPDEKHSFTLRDAVFRVIKDMFKRMQLDTVSSNLICTDACIISLGRSIVASARRCQPTGEPVQRGTSSHPLYANHVVLEALARMANCIRASKQNAIQSETHPVLSPTTSNGHQESTYSTKETQTTISETRDSLTCHTSEVSRYTRSVTLHKSPDALFLDHEILTSSQYYATGAVAYLLREPCIMCSMALLHNRISVAVFPKDNQNKKFGGLGGLMSIHANKRLNHRFHVLQVDV